MVRLGASLAASLAAVVFPGAAQAQAALSLSDARLKKDICGAHPCRLELVGRAASPAGQAQVSIVRWALCDEPAEAAPQDKQDAYHQMQADYACGIGYFRALHDKSGVTEVRFVVADSNAGLTGYGAGGGEESVAFDAKASTLAHDINGGSSSRWGNGKRWRVAPDFALLESYETANSRLNLEWNSSAQWQASTGLVTGSVNYNACRLNPKTRRWEVALDADNNSVDMSQASFVGIPTSAAAFDWRRAALPDWLEVRADTQPGFRRHSVATTRTSAPSSPFAMRLLWLDATALLIEIDGAAAPTSQAPRIEIWWWEQPESGDRGCVLSPKAAKRGTLPGAASDENNGEVQVAQGVKQMLLSLDGVATPAFGAPAASQMKVERASVDGKPRLLVRWNDICGKPAPSGCQQVGAGVPHAVALSLPLGKRQHLVSHADLRFADPTSFAVPTAVDTHLQSPAALDEWKQMIEARFKPATPQR